jgi:hypothetical protein
MNFNDKIEFNLTSIDIDIDIDINLSRHLLNIPKSPPPPLGGVLLLVGVVGWFG